MKRKIVTIFKFLLLPFFCFVSSCSKEQITTILYEVSLKQDTSITSFIKKNQNTLFIVSSEYDCILAFSLVIPRNNRKNNEEAIVEHFKDKEMKNLINSYEYQYFLFAGKNDMCWMTYFELECKKDELIFLNVRGKKYSGGDKDIDCDTYYCSFYKNSDSFSDIKNSAWPIVE